MRGLGAGLAALACAALVGAAPASADEEREARLERELEAMKARVEALEAERVSPAPAGAAPAEPDAAPPAEDGPGVEVTPTWDREGETTPPALRGVYDKPFLVDLYKRAYIGGYTELEYHSFEDEALGIPRGFRAHRTNLFIYGDLTDRLRFASEIELEHEEPGEDIEIALEMAFVEWALFEELAFRGGVIVPPLGRVNVNHDGPVRALTDRPLVSTFVIPTTISEAGVGITGRISAGRSFGITYEVYAVNGFAILDRDGQLAAPIAEREQLLREGRPSLGGDFNPNVATTGRVGVELFDVLELGGSWHIGTYDERSDNLLSILAADAAIVLGPLTIEGELAWAGFERDAFARTAGMPDAFWGWYAQAELAGMPGVLRRTVPIVFDDEGAALGVVVRFDHVDLDGDEAQAIEPGITFRPFRDTIFKASYRFGLLALGERGGPGREAKDDDGFIFGFSSYF